MTVLEGLLLDRNHQSDDIWHVMDCSKGFTATFWTWFRGLTNVQGKIVYANACNSALFVGVYVHVSWGFQEHPDNLQGHHEGQSVLEVQ